MMRPQRNHGSWTVTLCLLLAPCCIGSIRIDAVTNQLISAPPFHHIAQPVLCYTRFQFASGQTSLCLIQLVSEWCQPWSIYLKFLLWRGCTIDLWTVSSFNVTWGVGDPSIVQAVSHETNLLKCSGTTSQVSVGSDRWPGPGYEVACNLKWTLTVRKGSFDLAVRESHFKTQDPSWITWYLARFCCAVSPTREQRPYV